MAGPSRPLQLGRCRVVAEARLGCGCARRRGRLPGVRAVVYLLCVCVSAACPLGFHSRAERILGSWAKARVGTQLPLPRVFGRSGGRVFARLTLRWSFAPPQARLGAFPPLQSGAGVGATGRSDFSGALRPIVWTPGSWSRFRGFPAGATAQSHLQCCPRGSGSRSGLGCTHLVNCWKGLCVGAQPAPCQGQQL